MKNIMMKKNLFFYFSILFACVLTACEKADFDDEDVTDAQDHTKKQISVSFNVVDIRQIPYTVTSRSFVDITSYVSRLNFALFQNGERVRSTSQKTGDDGFGSVVYRLMPGTYQLLVLAHNTSAKKESPATTNPAFIKFTNDNWGVSDTFYYYGDIEVNTQNKTHDVVLQRASSLLRFIITDELPTDLYYVKLSYTGGSCALNAVTGYGANDDDVQEKTYQVDGYTAPLTLPVYTFLKGDEGKLNVTVTAMDGSNNTILQRTFENISMNRASITEHSGSFFYHDNALSLKADVAWKDTLYSTY
jgi:hypothetical protein